MICNIDRNHEAWGLCPLRKNKINANQFPLMTIRIVFCMQFWFSIYINNISYNAQQL